MEKKRSKITNMMVSIILTVCMVFGMMPGGLQLVKPVEAAGESGILNNGLGGISININATPYTTFATYSYGQYAYTDVGCAWFASARINQLTGYGNTIRSGTNWWNNNPYGWEKGGTDVVKAPAVVCWSGHVAIIEKIEGDTAYISEGGNWGDSNSAHGYCSIRQVSRSNIASLNSGYLGCIYLPGATSGGYNPQGYVDSFSGGKGQISVSGWTFDKDAISISNEVHVYLDDVCLGGWIANTARTDVDAAYNCGAFHGFDLTIPTDVVGTHRVRVYAINTGGGTNVLLGEADVYIESAVNVLPVSSSAPVQSSMPLHTTQPCKIEVSNNGNSTFDVTLKGLEDGTDLVMFDYGLVYDNTKLSVEKIQWDSSFEDGYTIGISGKKDGGILAEKDQGTYVVLGGGHFLHDTYVVTSAQKIAKVTFRVKDGKNTGDMLLVEDSAKYNFDFSDAEGTVLSAEVLSKLLNDNNEVITSPEELEDNSRTLGDVDGDKEIILNDAQLTLKAALKIQNLDAKYQNAADVDRDGEVTLADAQVILKVALKIGTIEELSGNMIRISSMDVFYEERNNVGRELYYSDGVEDNLKNMNNDVLLGGDYTRTYLLDGTFKELRGTFFILKKYASTKEKAKLYVYDDTTLLYEETITGGEFPKDIKIDISGVKKLRIRYSGYCNYNGLNSKSSGAFAGLANCAVYR